MIRVTLFVSVLYFAVFLQGFCDDKPKEHGYLHGILYGHANETSNRTILDRVIDRMSVTKEHNYTINLPEMIERTHRRLRERVQSLHDRIQARLQERRERLQNHFNKRLNRWIELIDRHNQRSGDETNRTSFSRVRRILDSVRSRFQTIEQKPQLSENTVPMISDKSNNIEAETSLNDVSKP